MSTTPIAELSVAISNAHFEILSEYYISKTIEPHLATYNQLTNSADSIYRLLYESELHWQIMQTKAGVYY
jgi:hypothetical protein